MEDFTNMLTAGYTWGQVLGYYFFMFLGIALYGLLEIKNRDVNSPSTPRKFNLKFWYRDNVKRYIATLMLLYIQFRFFEQITGNELGEYTSFLLGFSSDGIIGMQKKANNILNSDREKLLSTYNTQHDEKSRD
jgi:hypothetical protein